MSQHLKTRVLNRLSRIIGKNVQLPLASSPRARGVKYFTFIVGIDSYCGAMSSAKEGHRYKKHIIVRGVPHSLRLHQLYTYHFPKTWSAACVANRELIKEAQRQAHALEHAHTPEALEWRIRFFIHYFSVVKGGAQPAPGLKCYAHFYPFAYVSIYRRLQSLSLQTTSSSLLPAQEPDLVSFEEVDLNPLHAFSHRRSTFSCTRSAAHHAFLAPSHDDAFILAPRLQLIC